MMNNFYESIPIFDEFAEAMRPENYRSLPHDWVVGFSDVVGSTDAAKGRDKAARGVIAAVARGGYTMAAKTMKTRSTAWATKA